MNIESGNTERLADLSVQINASSGSFPIDLKGDTLFWDENIAGNYHWHPDLQFVYLLSGSLEYFINGQSVKTAKGQMLFINSRRLHYITSDRADGTHFVAIRINPNIFTVESRSGYLYFQRKFGLNNVDYMVLDPKTDWCAQAIDAMNSVVEKHGGVDENPLPALREALRLVELVGSHIEDMPVEQNTNQDQLIYLNMAQFIRESYKSKLRIEDISNAGHVSRAKTYALFDRYAHMSPNTYITNFRLSRSMILLRDTNLSISEIAALCGFQSSSYFTSVFSKEKGMTPREYRAFIKDLISSDDE